MAQHFRLLASLYYEMLLRDNSKRRLLQAEPALMYDSVHVFAKGLAALDRSHVLRPMNLSCDLEQPWDDGLSLYNYINSVSIY